MLLPVCAHVGYCTLVQLDSDGSVNLAPTSTSGSCSGGWKSQPAAPQPWPHGSLLSTKQRTRLVCTTPIPLGLGGSSPALPLSLPIRGFKTSQGNDRMLWTKNLVFSTPCPLLTSVIHFCCICFCLKSVTLWRFSFVP